MPDAGALLLHEAAVRPGWVDYNRHMSEAYYVLIFGDATDAFYDHVGMGSAYRADHGVSVYTLEAHIRYLVETPEGQRVRVATRLVSHDSKRLRLHHAMLRAEDEVVLAVTELLAMHVNKTCLRGAAFPPFIAHRLSALVSPVPEPAVSRHWAA